MTNYSFVDYTGNGVTKTYGISFIGEDMGYIRQTDVLAFVDGERVNSTINVASPHLVILDNAPVVGAKIRIKRVMPKEIPYADFSRGNNFGYRQVNNSFLQQLYLTHELLDGFKPEGYYEKQPIDMGGNRIINLGDAINETDAVNLKTARKVIGNSAGLMQEGDIIELTGISGQTINLEFELVGIAQLEVNAKILPPSYYEIVDTKTIELKKFFLTPSDVVVLRYTTKASSISSNNQGRISLYLDQGLSLAEAIASASNDSTVVNFEGLELETDEPVVVPSGAICRKWLLEGAKLKFNYGQVVFNNRMSEIDLGGGEIDLGLRLAKVTQEGSKDAISLVVDNSHKLEVGDFVSSSLDINHLPNSSDRVGYLENGDYNRIQSISPINQDEDLITLTYNFLLSSNPDVYSGLIENAWVGNGSFLLTGLDFRGNPDGFLKIHNGKILNPRGYYFTLFNGAGDARKATVELDIVVENAFIDMVRFRGFGITFGKNYHAMRQYDLAKQHLVCSTPEDGFIKFQAGCRSERQNGDAEVFCTPFEAGDTLAECGVIDVEKGVFFNGTKPEDLPESDFSSGGQIYFGYKVPIHDCYHFVQPNAPRVKMGGTNFNGKVVGFSRSIYGTTFSPKDEFDTGTICFTGANLSCEPVYIAINGGTTPQERMSKYGVSLDGCYIESRSLPNFDGGAYIHATQCYIKLPEANRGTPQIPSAQGFNYIVMDGGYLDGRYAIAGSDTILRNVHVPYSEDPANVPIFQGGALPNPNDTHLILDPPINNLYLGSTPFEDVYQTLDMEKWIGSNFSTVAPAPPNLRFKFNNYPQVFNYGGTGGFAKRYQMEMTAARVDLPPIPTKGKWSGLQTENDYIFVRGQSTSIIIDKTEITTLANVASKDDPTVQVTTPPTGVPEVIGIYQSSINLYIYYNVEDINGAVITLGSTYTANTGVFPNNGHGFGAEVVFLYYKGATEETQTSSGVFVERDADLLFPTGGAANMIFDTVQYDDANYFDAVSNNKVVIPAGVGRVDISGYVELNTSGVAALTQAHLRIIQRDSGGSRVRIAAAYGGNIGYTDFKQSVAASGIPVSEGDYFELSFRHNNSSSVTVQNSYLQLRSA